jgi:hypothetical protein
MLQIQIDHHVRFPNQEILLFTSRSDTSSRVKIRIEMSRQHYDYLLVGAAKDSRVYTTLMSSVVFRQSESLLPDDTVITVCDDHEARALLDLAKECCPDAASAIEETLKNPQSG